MEVTVGAFMFMVLLALAFFTIILSREQLWRKYHALEAHFEEVLGVREGDNVYLRGVVIGRVKRIETEPDGVLLRMSLERAPALRTDYRIEILPSSVLGGRYVSIYEGSRDAPPLPPGTRLVGLPPVDLIETATHVVERVRAALEEEGVLANVKASLQNLNDITSKIARGEGTLGRLVNEEGVHNEIAAAAADLRKAAGWLASGESSLSRLISDNGEIYKDAAEIARNLREASGRLNEAESLLGKLLAPDDTVYNDLKAAAASLRDVTDRIARGEGALGKLATESELYEEVRLLINEMRATIDDFRETAPISTFTSILFGAF